MSNKSMCNFVFLLPNHIESVQHILWKQLDCARGKFQFSLEMQAYCLRPKVRTAIILLLLLALFFVDLVHLQYSETASVNNALIWKEGGIFYLSGASFTASRIAAHEFFPLRCLFVSTFSLCCGRDISMQMDSARGSAALIM